MQLTQTIAHRVDRFLERQGLLERDAEISYLTTDENTDPMNQLHGHSVTYRIAMGPLQGRKVFTLQTLPPRDDDLLNDVGKVGGFSLHAGVATKANKRDKLERICRYDAQGSTNVARGRKPGATIAHPAISEKRLSLTKQGKVRFILKTPYRNGTTHVTALAHPVLRGISTSMYKIFEPLDFIAKLAALVPKPRANLTRYHGVFAPSKHRARVTPAKRGKGLEPKVKESPTDCERRKAMTGFCSCKTGIHAIHGNIVGSED